MKQILATIVSLVVFVTAGYSNERIWAAVGIATATFFFCWFIDSVAQDVLLEMR